MKDTFAKGSNFFFVLKISPSSNFLFYYLNGKNYKKITEQLELQGNDVTGAVSEGLCNRTGIKFFDISVLTVDCDEVNCTCCNNC